MHTHHARTIQWALFWPSLVGLSLLAVSQAHFNNCTYMACSPSALLSSLAHLSQTGTAAWQEDRMLSPIVTNNIGLSYFGGQSTEKGKVTNKDKMCRMDRHMLWWALCINSHFLCACKKKKKLELQCFVGLQWQSSRCTGHPLNAKWFSQSYRGNIQVLGVKENDRLVASDSLMQSFIDAVSLFLKENFGFTNHRGIKR